MFNKELTDWLQFGNNLALYLDYEFGKRFCWLNMINVVGRGAQKGVVYVGRAGEKTIVDMLPKVKLQLVVRDADTEKVINIILASARTGKIGDGKIFIITVADVNWYAPENVLSKRSDN